MRDDLNGMKTELSDVRSGLEEIKGLLARLTEEKLSEGKGGLEPKEPKEETGDNQQGRRQQSPQPCWLSPVSSFGSFGSNPPSTQLQSSYKT